MVCDTCREDWSDDRFNPDCASPNTCFRCRANSIGVAYLAYPHGRKEFAGATIRERQEKELAEGKAAGLNLRPAWYRPYSGGYGGAFGAPKKTETAAT